MYLLASISLGGIAGSLGAKILIPIIIAIVIVPLMDALKRVWSWLDEAPPAIKQLTVTFLAAIGTVLAPLVGALIGADVPVDLRQWDTQTVSALLAALLGIAFKQKKQLKRADDVIELLAQAPVPMPAPSAPPAGNTIRLANGEEWPMPGGN